jgi:hypothetical protein
LIFGHKKNLRPRDSNSRRLCETFFAFQVSQNGLDIIGLLIERLGHGFKMYVNTVIGAVVDRLGDTREIVREKAAYVLTR